MWIEVGITYLMDRLRKTVDAAYYFLECRTFPDNNFSTIFETCTISRQFIVAFEFFYFGFSVFVHVFMFLFCIVVFVFVIFFCCTVCSGTSISLVWGQLIIRKLYSFYLIFLSDFRYFLVHFYLNWCLILYFSCFRLKWTF